MRTAHAVVALSSLVIALAQQPPYDASEAKRFVYMAAAAYCDNSSLLSWSCKACGEIPIQPGSMKIHYSGQEDVKAYTAKLANGTAIVSFRGTVDLVNWIENLKSAFQTDYPYNGCQGCKVADGFNQAYDLLRPQIMSALQGLGVGPGGEVLVTGHSLGAAMAGLCAFDLKTLGYDVSGYTFGQPRDGDATYSSTFNRLFPREQGKWFHVVHNADIVVHLPPEFLGFKHTDTEVWYNEDFSSYKVCDGSGEDPTCSDSVDLPISIDDHLNYLGVPISRYC